MRKYINIFYVCFKRSLIRDMTFKANFIIRFFTDAIYLFIYILFFTVLFGKVSEIAGWSKHEVILLLGTFHIIISLFFSFFFPNLLLIPMHVNRGSLDGFIKMPVDTQFVLSINNIDTGSITNGILGLIFVIRAMTALNMTVDIIQIINFVFYIIVGVGILYCTFFIALMTSFWLQEANWCIGLFMTLNGFADKPISIYKGLIGRIFVYLIPYALIANVPSAILLNKDIQNFKSVAFLSLIFLFLLGRHIWKNGLKRYEGASI